MEPLAHPLERRSAEPPARIVAAVLEVPPVPVQAAVRAIQRAALSGIDPLRAFPSPTIVWAPRASGAASPPTGPDLFGDDPIARRSLAEADGWSFAGWGVAARADGEGEGRFAEVMLRAERLFGRLDRAGALPIAPRLFGGFAFDAGASRARSPDVARERGELARTWAPFGDATFLLPRLLHGCSGDRAFVAAFAPEPEAAAALAGAARAALTAQGTRQIPVEAADRSSLDGSIPGAVFEGGGERAWIDLVRAALDEIGRGELHKVVLCRTRRVTFEREPDLIRALAVLLERHPSCARFLFEQGGATFLGASPERLVLVRGRRAVTEALAGSLPRRDGEDVSAARSRLLASAKDRAEHAFVVDAIRAALAPVCDALAVAGEPLVRSLAHVHHLATPVTATLRDRVHVLDLARRLHPTPALCGTPRAEARAFLLAREPEPRGWYGGGAGWFDAAGDGELTVAIRSALTARRAAWIYAGAGIVSGSDPATEHAETTTKERAMREALEAAA